MLITLDKHIPKSINVDSVVLPFCLSDGEECVASTLDYVPCGFQEIGLRESYEVLPYKEFLRAGKAYELLYWNNNHIYCSSCGSMLISTSYISKKCPKCGREIWPMLSPAIIVLIYDDDRILLVRSKTFKGSFYGLIAGFVEFGETIEETVVREITEETQLQVENIKYFGSQPWPYPQGLMLGFFAHYKSGELRLQDSELASGNWFSISDLPELPSPVSMARKLIDYYINNYSVFSNNSH